MEIFLQIILEPIFYAYYDLAENFTDCKKLKKWQEHLLKISCLIVFIIAFFLVLIGGVFVANDIDSFKTCGIVFLIIGGIILFVHILIGLFVGTNHFVEEKRKEEALFNKKFEENKPAPQVYHVNKKENDNNKL